MPLPVPQPWLLRWSNGSPTTLDGSAEAAPTRTPVGGHFVEPHGMRPDEHSAAPNPCGTASRDPSTVSLQAPSGLRTPRWLQARSLGPRRAALPRLTTREETVTSA